MLGFVHAAVLRFKKDTSISHSFKVKMRSWQNHSMALRFWPIFVGWASHEKLRSCYSAFALRRQAVLQEHAEAICPSGIHPPKCSASLRPKAPKWSLRFYWRLSMTTMYLKSGISHRPFRWNIAINVVVCNDRCIHQTTFCFVQAWLNGLNANPRKSL